jgi:hypothetical protein
MRVGETEGPVDFNQILNRRYRNKKDFPWAVHVAMFGVTSAILSLLCPASALCADKNAAGPRAQQPPVQKPSEPGPSSPNAVDRVVYYFPSRAADLLDIWKINVAVGPGVAINFRPTKSLQIGLGAYYATRVGLHGRRSPIWYEESSEGGFDGMYYEGGNTERGFHEFGGTIHFLLIGFEMAFDIEEALDFGYGLFMSDPLDDDFR